MSKIFINGIQASAEDYSTLFLYLILKKVTFTKYKVGDSTFFETEV